MPRTAVAAASGAAQAAARGIDRATRQRTIGGFGLGEKAVEWILLATSSATDHLSALDLLRQEGVAGRRVVTSRYADELDALRVAGADVALHVFDEAGAGLADHVLESDQASRSDRPERLSDRRPT